MTYKFELFLVIQKRANKYKIIQTLSFSNFIYSVMYIWLFFLRFIYIGLLVFYTKLTHLTQKLKKILIRWVTHTHTHTHIYVDDL